MNEQDKFLEKVLVFVDRNGEVKSKESTPFSSSLTMKYEDRDNLLIEMDVFANGFGNGSCRATITYEKKIVYRAKSNYTSSPFNTKEEVYIPGEWEKLIGI
jgi:hypothetical protein